MKIQLVSDTHYGMHQECTLVNPKANILILAGDIVSHPRNAKYFLTSLRKESDIPVLYVLGNHEFYDGNLYTTVDRYKKALKSIPDVHILEKEVFEYEGVNFLGMTMWTDLSDPLVALAAQASLNDYEFIERKPGEHIRPSDVDEEYQTNKAWLEENLKALRGQENVVITHHAPTVECRNTYYDYERGNVWRRRAFCNELTTLIQQNDIKLWCYGHTHRTKSLKLKGTRIVSNQMGFVGGGNLYLFSKDLLLEV